MKKQCPRCGGEARRSHHHGLIQKTILRALSIRPYRCRDCGNRFFRFSANSSHHSEPTSKVSVFDQPERKNGEFQEVIAQIRKKEAELGLGKQDQSMTDELRQLRDRVQEEGLTADSPQRHREHRETVN